MKWNDAEKNAAEELYNLYDYDWKRHAHEYHALDDRSLESISGYIKNNIRAPMAPPTPRVKRGAWPEPGILINGRFVGNRLFEISANAVCNHGSPGAVSPGLTRSMSGSSALWTSEAA